MARGVESIVPFLFTVIQLVFVGGKDLLGILDGNLDLDAREHGDLSLRRWKEREWQKIINRAK